MSGKSARTKIVLSVGAGALLTVTAFLFICRHWIEETYQVWRLESGNSVVRKNACKWLSKLGSPRCIPALLRIAEVDGDVEVWSNAADAAIAIEKSNGRSNLVLGDGNNPTLAARLLFSRIALNGVDVSAQDLGIEVVVLIIETVSSMGRVASNSIKSQLIEASRSQYDKIRVAALVAISKS